MVRLRCVDTSADYLRAPDMLLFGMHELIQVEELIIGPEGDLKKALFAVSREHTVVKELVTEDNLRQIPHGTTRLCSTIAHIAGLADKFFLQCGKVAVHAQNADIQKQDLLPLGPGQYVKLAVHCEYRKVTSRRAAQFAHSLFGGTRGKDIASSVRKMNGYIDIWHQHNQRISVYIYVPAGRTSADRLSY